MRLLREYHEEGVDALCLGGEIDMHFAPTLRSLLQAKARQKCPALLLDLSAVDFIDSVRMAAMLEYLRDATDNCARFCIGGFTEPLRVTFEVVGLGKVMPVTGTRRWRNKRWYSMFTLDQLLIFAARAGNLARMQELIAAGAVVGHYDTRHGAALLRPSDVIIPR